MYYLIQLDGQKTNDLYKQKTPNRFLRTIEQQVKLKTSVLEKHPELFPELRHPAGCSLQYLILIAECLNTQNKWYEEFINRHDEYVDGSKNSKIVQLLDGLVK